MQQKLSGYWRSIARKKERDQPWPRPLWPQGPMMSLNPRGSLRDHPPPFSIPLSLTPEETEWPFLYFDFVTTNIKVLLFLSWMLDLNDLMPSLAHLSLNHYHSHSCRPFLRRWKTEVRNGSYRCNDPCSSHKNSPNHEEIPITMDLFQTIHLLHNDHSMPPETFSLLKECLVRDLMTTQYTADAVLCLWSKYLGHGKNWSKSENNMRQKRKDRGRDANGIAQRRRLCAKLKRRYPRRGQNCAKPHCFALLTGLHKNLSQGSEAVKLIKLFPVSRR